MSALYDFFDQVGRLFALFLAGVRAMFRPPFEWAALAEQIRILGAQSLPITTLTGLFAGMVLCLQFGTAMERFGAKDWVGNVTAVSIFRELGPVLTALMVGGRVGSGITAELGSMNVNEQIDAIRALGADPVKKLVLPRVLAAVIVLPLLTAITDAIGVMGGMVVANLQFDISYDYFYSRMFVGMKMSDYLSGIGKSPFFGFFIALIACHVGMTTTGGTEGVGRATTRTVVYTSVNTLIVNFVLTKLFLGR